MTILRLPIPTAPPRSTIYQQPIFTPKINQLGIIQPRLNKSTLWNDWLQQNFSRLQSQDTIYQRQREERRLQKLLEMQRRREMQHRIEYLFSSIFQGTENSYSPRARINNNSPFYYG